MKVSVIIPMYNAERTIGRTLDSVLSQTCPDVHIIVVNDGSVDGGREIVRRYDDPRITLIDQGNAGVSAARNQGIEAAETDWVAFLDADDAWQPEFLARTTAFVREHTDVVSVFTNALRDGQPWLTNTPERAGVLPNYFRFCVVNYGRGLTSGSGLHRRQALHSIGSFPTQRKMGEDIDTWVRLAWEGPIGFIPEPLFIYHNDNPDSATHSFISDSRPVETYRCWLAQGRIPTAMLTSTARYINVLSVIDANARIRNGLRQEARKIMSEDFQWQYGPHWLMLRTYCYLLSPTWLRSMVLQLRST
ncbi:MAG: glycosyltransferase family 2 protein [Armatimonadota bacterium]